jgi:hypothetical protein
VKWITRDADHRHRGLPQARRGADQGLVPEGRRHRYGRADAGYAETVRRYGSSLEAILDRATVEIVREQVDLGVDTPADGEVRRENYIH